MDGLWRLQNGRPREAKLLPFSVPVLTPLELFSLSPSILFGQLG